MTLKHPTSTNHSPAKMQANKQAPSASQAIEVWINKSSQHAGTSRNEREPHAFSESQGKEMRLSDLDNMTTEELKLIASEMFVVVTSLNEAVATEHMVLLRLTSDQPAAIQKIKQRITALLAKKRAARLIGTRAGILAKQKNREAHKPNPPRTRLVSNQNQLNAFERAQGKMKHLKNQIWYRLLAAEIGVDRLRLLEVKAAKDALPAFLAWAEKNDIENAFVEKIAQDFCGADHA